MRVTGLIIPRAGHVEGERLEVSDAAADELVVRVAACGLCTWEQRVFRGAKPTYPFWGGHEVCGVVEESGPDAREDLLPGDFVALALMRRCGACHACRRGLDNHCAYLRPEVNDDSLPRGPRGLSDRLVVPAYQAVRLDSLVGWRRGTLIEPLACSLRSVRRSGVTTGDEAVVIGGGTLGALHTAALAAAGVRVLVCDLDGRAGDQMKRAGASLCLSGTPEEVTAAILEECGAGGVSAVFCTRGGPAWIEAAVRMCRRDGTVVLFQSVRGEDRISFSANDLHYREIRVIGSISQRLEDFVQAAALVKLRPQILDCISTESFSHEQAREAFRRSVENCVNRVLVTFPQ
jgi:L-iditol 2-dehydrogenase